MNAIQQEILEALGPQLRRIQEQITQLTEALEAKHGRPGDTPVPLKEAAEIAGVTDRTLRRWIAEGKIESQRRGRQILIKPNDLFTNE